MLKAKFRQSVRALSSDDYFVLGVSLGSKNYEGEALRAVVEAINATNLKKGVVDVSDTLARHTMMIVDMTEQDAHRKTQKDGLDWVNRHKEILDGLEADHSIIHWDHWLEDKRFSEYKKAFETAFRNDTRLKAAITKDIQNFYKRKFNQAVIEHTNKDIQHSINYYLEELAVMSIQFEDFPGAQIYAGKELESLKLVRTKAIPNVPYGITQSKFYRLSISGDRISPSQKYG